VLVTSVRSDGNSLYVWSDVVINVVGDVIETGDGRGAWPVRVVVVRRPIVVVVVVVVVKLLLLLLLLWSISLLSSLNLTSDDRQCDVIGHVVCCL